MSKKIEIWYNYKLIPAKVYGDRMDIVNKEIRSKNMAAIKGKDTKPEITLRKWLFARGYRYSLNSKKIAGHPDIYLRKYNTVIFINGCFWHRHENCKYAYVPKSNVEFWEEKFKNNVKRDQRVKEAIISSRVKMLVVWECTIKKMIKDEKYRACTIEKIEDFFVSQDLYLEL